MDEATAAKIREGQRSWARKVARVRRAAKKSLTLAILNPDPKNREAAVDAVVRYAGCHESGERLPATLSLIFDVPPCLFWPTFLTVWSTCDATWPYRNEVLDVLKRQHAKERVTAYLPSEAREFFNKLPPKVTVYRGCSRDRVFGLAWTTDRSIAEGFANGHRGILVPNAVVARTAIRKEAIFFACLDRKEAEVVIDPQEIRSVTHTPVRHRQARR
jgi:hypothetical protein